MAGRGTVEVTEAELASNVRLRTGPPSGQLTIVRPAPPTVLSLMLVGTLILVDAGAPFVPMTSCIGTGRNADIGAATVIGLSLDGTPIAAAGLSGSFALDAQRCGFGFLIPTPPLEQRPYALTIAGHGSIEVPPQQRSPWQVILILNESGELSVCDSTNPSTIQC